MLWNAEDGFYYDGIMSNNLAQFKPLRVKSMVGLIALFASSCIRRSEIQALSKLKVYLAESGDKLHSSVSI